VLKLQSCQQQEYVNIEKRLGKNDGSSLLKKQGYIIEKKVVATYMYYMVHGVLLVAVIL
jgi:hypothetical protein